MPKGKAPRHERPFGIWRRSVESRTEGQWSELRVRLVGPLLACGVVGSALAIGVDLIAGSRWRGYSFVARSASDLSAVGSPTRPLVVPLGVISDGLLLASGVGFWRAAGHGRAARTTAVLVTGNAVLQLAAELVPWHLDEPESSPANKTNVVVMAPAVLCLVAAVGFGAAASRGRFRIYSIATFLTWVVGDLLGTAFAWPNIAGRRGRTVGLQERSMIYGYLLWVTVLALHLRQAGAAWSPTSAIPTGLDGSRRPIAHHGPLQLLGPPHRVGPRCQVRPRRA